MRHFGQSIRRLALGTGESGLRDRIRLFHFACIETVQVMQNCSLLRHSPSAERRPPETVAAPLW